MGIIEIEIDFWQAFVILTLPAIVTPFRQLSIFSEVCCAVASDVAEAIKAKTKAALQAETDIGAPQAICVEDYSQLWRHSTSSGRQTGA